MGIAVEARSTQGAETTEGGMWGADGISDGATTAAGRVFALADLRRRILAGRACIMAIGWWHVVPERCASCTQERKGGLEGTSPIKWLECLTHDRWLCDEHRTIYDSWPLLHNCGDWVWPPMPVMRRGEPVWRTAWPQETPRASMHVTVNANTGASEREQHGPQQSPTH